MTSVMPRRPIPPVPPEDIEAASRRIKKAVVDLTDHPSLKPLSLVAMVGRKTITDQLPTAATDGFNEWYNPHFVMSLSYKAAQFLVGHESGHKFLKHTFVWTEQAKADKDLANIAMDFVVNLMLFNADRGVDRLEPPEDIPPLLDQRVDGWSVGRIFQWCIDKADGKAPPLTGTTVREWAGKRVITLDDIEFKRGGGGDGGENGNDGGSISGEGGPQQDDRGRVSAKDRKTGDSVGSIDEHERGSGGATGKDGDNHPSVTQSDLDLLDKVIKSSSLMNRMGSNTGGRMFEATAAEFDWRDGLDDWARQIYVGGSSESWTRPNRRYMAHGIYLPTHRSEILPPILLAIDTSGSIGTESLSQVIARVALLSQQYRVESVHVVYWDTSVVGHEIYETSDFAEVSATTRPKGGGGTDPSCVARYVVDLPSTPHYHGVIVFTDGYVGDNWGDWSFADNRVLWIIDGFREANPDVGTVLHKA